MKSHKHRVPFLRAGIVLLFVLALAVAPSTAQSGGLNVLAVSQADYSWSGEFQEDAWILLVSQSSSGEQIYCRIPKEDIKGIDPITGEEGFATHDIEITMRPISTTCKYCIKPSGSHIYTASVYAVEREYLTYDWHGETLDSDEWCGKCTASGGDCRKNEGRFLGPDTVLACFYTTDMGTHGVLQTPTYNYETEVIVTKKGDTQETFSTIISNRDKSTYLGSYGYIEWVGSLSSGECCPSSQDLPNAVYNPTGYYWTLTDNEGYDQYESYYSSEWGSCKHDFETYSAQDSDAAIERAENCVECLNEKANKALTPKTITEPVITSTDIHGDIVSANLKQGSVFYPTYKLILSSSWIGIYVPKPDPKIENIQSEWDAATSQGKIWMDIENEGDEGGDFTYGVTCQSPAQAIEPERSDYWDEGQVKTVEFTISGVVGVETMASYTVHVYATKYPELREEATKTITMKPIPTPTPTPARAAPTKAPPAPTTGAGPVTPVQETADAVTSPLSSFIPYAGLGLLCICIIMLFLWRKKSSGSIAEEGAESKESKNVDEKRPPSTKGIIAIIIIFVIIGAGFYLVTSFKEPEVSLKTVSVTGFESINLLIVQIPTEIIFSVVLDVYNPNILGATVTDVDYDLYVNDIYVGKGSLPRSVSIPANGRTNVETEVSVSISSSIQALIGVIQEGSATAKVTGNVYIGVPIKGSISVPFSKEQILV